jgi:hypothetical protein
MSRYCLRPLPHLGCLYEISIGWDQPLGTYFVAAFGPPDDNGDPALLRWIGSTFAEITNPSDAIAYARPLAELPHDIYKRLRLDQQKGPGPKAKPEGVISLFLRKPPLIAALS